MKWLLALLVLALTMPACFGQDAPAKAVPTGLPATPAPTGALKTDKAATIAAKPDECPRELNLQLAASYCRSAEGRGKCLELYGGSDKTEAAVTRALEWLQEHQNKDGCWSNSQPVAMTALALLCYSGHGETATSTAYGATVQKGTKYLVDKVMQGNGPLGDYAMGMATYALADACVATKNADPGTTAAMEKALKYIVAGQQSGGGWNYGYQKAERWDLSVSGWQLQAVGAGLVAEALVPGLRNARDRGVAWIRTVTYSKGQFGYSSPGAGSPAMQGAGTFCLQFLGEGGSEEAQTGAQWIAEHATVKWSQNTGFASYAWYYQTQALFHAGGQAWTNWNATCSGELLKNQKPDGHWESAGDKASGEYDRYLQTCFCCLMLEVYYRYVPVHRLQAVK